MAERTVASAPGKLVLSGEYAVLAGAPALVLAVDRRVRCALTPQSDGGWRIDGRGFAERLALTKEAAFAAPPDTTPGILRQAMAAAEAPDHLHVAVDSSACYLRGVKLGLGSSAATVTALATAAAALGGGTMTLPALIAIHQAFQGGGSGLDVAAAVTGGVIRFERGRVAAVRLPPGLRLAFVFTGTGTRTADLLARFHAWRSDGPKVLDRLLDAAHEVAGCCEDCTVTAETFIAALGEYAAVLQRLDRAAGIGIYGEGHVTAQALAASCRVVYKPSGAGGGDMGLALATDAERLAAFRAAASGTGLMVVDLEVGVDGVVVRTHQQPDPAEGPAR